MVHALSRVGDDCLCNIFRLLDVSALAAACCVWPWLDGHDYMWLGLTDGGGSGGGGAGGRRSKRLRQSGKEQFLHARRAVTLRSAELSTIVMWSLRQNKLSLKDLRKHIKSRAPVSVNYRDASGYVGSASIRCSPTDNHTRYVFCPP
jgi:hypothetical protein